MDTNRIAELLALMERSTLTALEVQQDGMRVRMERMPGFPYAGMGVIGAASGPVAMSAPALPEKLPAPAQAGNAGPAVEDKQPPAAQDMRSITSPMVGTFHPLPGGRAVKVGQSVKKGAAVCVVEAMKLMNEITAEFDCEIMFIAAKDGDMVEFGQVLFQCK